MPISSGPACNNSGDGPACVEGVIFFTCLQIISNESPPFQAVVPVSEASIICRSIPCFRGHYNNAELGGHCGLRRSTLVGYVLSYQKFTDARSNPRIISSFGAGGETAAEAGGA